ncbi:UPF0488 protein CG14286-like [Lineus longissimus]|uniref:UPF0488 protein CG14286-like n=1 Tax=Lineus longissimus TaxID=88925 RepID=UPI00315D3240
MEDHSISMSKQRKQRGGKQRPVPIVSQSSSAEVSQDDFERELYWCIQQIQLRLANKHVDAKQAAESVRILKILKNPNGPLVKKRQVMRSTFGDYRAKMKEEEKKFGIHKKASVKTVSDRQKQRCTFIKKATKPQQEIKEPHSVAEIEPGFTFKASQEDFNFGFDASDSGEGDLCPKESSTQISHQDSGVGKGTSYNGSVQEFKFNFPVGDKDNEQSSADTSGMDCPIHAVRGHDVTCDGDQSVAGLSKGVNAMSMISETGPKPQKDVLNDNAPFSWKTSPESFSFHFKIDDDS